MAIKIQKTSDIKIDSINCVIYGGAGVGKTRACATAPRPIIISAESGLLSLADIECDYVEIKSLTELKAAYRELKDSKDYDTICLDSLSEICEVLIADILPKHKNAMQAYGELAHAVMPELRKFRDLKGKNIVFTSKLKVVENEETGKITEELLLPGKVLGYQVPYMVDELFCLRMSKKGAILQTGPDRTRFCKDRSGALELEEKEIDLTKIFEKIMKKAS